MQIVEANPDKNPEDFYQHTIATYPVVVFALEWCEFCWSVKKLFDKCHIPYHLVNLDSATYQTDNFGKALRKAMSEQTGCITIPQVFVQGRFVGGATETFDELKQGQLQQRLDNCQVNHTVPDGLDPYRFLPDWLQSR
jgi:cysteine synthase A